MAKQVNSRKVSGQVTLRTRETGKGKSLYLDIYKDGVRSKEYLKMYLIPVKSPEDKITNRTTWEAAEAIARERAQAIVRGEAGIKVFKSKILLLDWMRWRVEQLTKRARGAGRPDNNAAKQVEKGAKHLEAYISKAYGKKPITLADVDKAFCVGYGEYLCKVMSRKNKHCPEKPLSSGTRDIYFKALSTALNIAVKEGHLPQNPMLLINRAEIIGKNEPAERVYLTLDELRKLKGTPCRRGDVRDAFLFSCMCGLRWSDINALKWGNLQMSGDEWRLEIRMVKTREMLYLPLNTEAKSCLPEQGEKGGADPIFSLPTLDCVENTLKQWAEDAKIDKHVTFHCARHTFATLMLTKGADLYTTSKLLGHADIRTTQIYAKIVDAKKAEAMNLLNGIL